MPANQKELSPQISPELLESPDQRPRSSSLNSLVSDVSVAGSEAVLETSSEGDSNAVFVQSAQNSILPKPPTPTVAPMMSSPVSNIFLPIKDPEEEINIPSQDPTIEDLNAQELFKNQDIHFRLVQLFPHKKNHPLQPPQLPRNPDNWSEMLDKMANEFNHSRQKVAL